MINYFMICLLICFWILMAFEVGIKSYRKFLNPISVYSSVWLVPTVLSLTGIYGMYIPDPLTVICILVNVIVFSIFASDFRRKSNIESAIKSSTFKGITDHYAMSNKYLKILVALNIVGVFWLIPYVTKMFPIVASGNWALARSYYLNANTYHLVYTTSSSLILQWIVVPIFYVTAIVSAYHVSINKINYKLILLNITNIVMLIIATAGRNSILKVVLFYMFAFFMVDDRERNIIKKLKESPIIFKIAIVVGIIAMGYITGQRKLSDDTTILQNLYVYLVGPILYFDNIMKNPVQYGLFTEYLFGRATFGFITTPIEIMSSLILEFDYAGADNIITSYTKEYVMISDTLKGNAFSTALYTYMKDFGWLGVIIGPACVGKIVGYAYLKARITVFNKAFWSCSTVFFMYIVAFSEWQYELVFPYSFSIIALLYIMLYRKRVIIRVIG